MSCHLVKRTPGTDPSQIKLPNSMQAASFLSAPTDCWEKWRPVTFAWLADTSNWRASAVKTLLTMCWRVVVRCCCCCRVLQCQSVVESERATRTDAVCRWRPWWSQTSSSRRRLLQQDATYWRHSTVTRRSPAGSYCFDDSDTIGNSADRFITLLAHPT